MSGGWQKAKVEIVLSWNIEKRKVKSLSNKMVIQYKQRTEEKKGKKDEEEEKSIAFDKFWEYIAATQNSYINQGVDTLIIFPY